MKCQGDGWYDCIVTPAPDGGDVCLPIAPVKSAGEE